VLARMVEARLRARADDLSDAESEAREAVALASGTDALALHADAVALLGELLLAAGRPSEARETLERAVELYELKGHSVGAERTREALGAAGAARAPTG
jgi:tetratricopeptide (TPR) repeat protein